MAKIRSFCPYCGSIVPAGQRCACRPKPKRKPTPGDQTRSAREPWRANYSSAEYQRARQTAISRTNGCCTDCGIRCAKYQGGKWRTKVMGGEVDHIKALCDGGTNDNTNLALRCKSCHSKRDAARRARKAP